MLEGLQRVVDRAGPVRWKGAHWRGGREHIVVRLAGRHRGLAQRRHLAVALKELGRAELGAAGHPGADIGQDPGLALGRQGRDVQPGAHAPEAVQAVDHGAGGKAGHPLHTRARTLEGLGGRLHGGADLGRDGQAPAGVQHQAQAQATQVLALARLQPGNVLRRQAGGVAPVGLGQGRHHHRGVFHRARHGPGHPAGIGWLDGNAAQAGLEREEPAPGRGQAHRAADVRAQVQGAIAGRGRGGRPGAGAAGVLAQVPGVAAQGMEAREARAQHAVVRHGGLGQQHGTQLAQPGGGRRVLGGGAEFGGRRAQGHGRAAGGDVFLERGGHAVQAQALRVRERLTAQPARLGRAGLVQHGLGLKRIERAQPGLPARHMVQQALRHLQRRKVATAVALDQGQGAKLVQGQAHGPHSQLRPERSLTKTGMSVHRPLSERLATVSHRGW